VDQKLVDRLLVEVEYAIRSRFWAGIPRADESIEKAAFAPGAAAVASAADVAGVLQNSEELLAAEQPGLALVAQGGKRWRPLLLVLICRLCGGAERHAVEIAAAVELAHSGSLIIDDIEDGADVRRGQPTAHRRFGLDAAVNGGNLLYCLPGEIFAAAGLEPPTELALHRLYWQALVRLHYGQGLDISWHRDPARMPQVAEYMAMCRLKSGSTAGLAARMGAMLAGAETQTVAALAAAGEDFGVSFQIIDDVRNLTTGNPGKLRGDDLVEGKKSLPLLLAVNKDAATAAALGAILVRIASLNSEHDALSPPAKPTPAASREQALLIEEAITIMQAVGSIEEARQLAVTRYQQTRGVLAALPSVDRSILATLLALTDHLIT
jgi:geranylgeranyl pyrophosphate synthase